MNGQKIRVEDAEIVSDVMITNRVPGKVIFMSHNSVVCGTGLIKILKASDMNGKDILPLLKFRSRFGQ